MISFNVKDVQTVEKVLSKVQLVMFAESLGGVESLITYLRSDPCCHTGRNEK